MHRHIITPKRYLLTVFFIASLLLSGSGNPVYAERASESRIDQIVIRFEGGIGETQALELLKQHDLAPVQYLPQIEVWVAANPGQRAEVLASELSHAPQVAWAEPDGWLYASEVVPNDNFYQAQQENLRVVGLPYAWELSTGDSNPIAVVDTGIDLNHNDLENKVWSNPNEIPDNDLDDDGNGYIDDVLGWNFVSGDADPQDDSSHGSHVSGIAAAQTNNITGIAGVAWLTPVMALKALNSQGSGLSSDVAEAILYAADNEARLINLSLGTEEAFQVITDAVEYAQGKGCLLVAAAGNGGGAVEFPAALPGVLAVAATDNSDLPASFSNRGPQVDLAAPGVDIFSTNRLGSYNSASGTSTSAPHVSGLAALVWAMRPEWSAVQVSLTITSTAQDVWAPGRDDLTGWGRINAQRATLAALHQVYLTSVFTPPPEPTFIYLPVVRQGKFTEP